jgi:hypothetical protein
MSAEQPVRCGCGSEPFIYEDKHYCYIKCTNRLCMISISDETRGKAVSLWNLAMGAKLREAVAEWIACRNGKRGPGVDYQDVCDRLEAAMKEATP